jgi:hypothetical protein
VRYAQVEVVGTTSPTRVVVNAWDLHDPDRQQR